MYSYRNLFLAKKIFINHLLNHLIKFGEIKVVPEPQKDNLPEKCVKIV